MLKSLLWILIKILEISLSFVFLYSCWSFEYPQGLLYELWGFPILAYIIAGIIKGWILYLNRRYKKNLRKGWIPFNITNFFLITSASSLTYHLLDTLPQKTFFEYITPLDIPYKTLFYIAAFTILFCYKRNHHRSNYSLMIVLLFSSSIFSVPMDISRYAVTIYHAIAIMTLIYFLFELKTNNPNTEARLKINIHFIRLLPPIILFMVVGILSGIYAVCSYTHILEFLGFIDYFIVFLIVSIKSDERNCLILTGIAFFNLLFLLGLGLIKLGLLTSELGSMQSFQYRFWIAQLHPNFTAAFLVLFAPIFLSFFVFSKRKSLSIIGISFFILMVVFLLLTYTKAAWIGLVLSFLPLIYFVDFKKFFFEYKGIMKKKKWILITITLILLVILFMPKPVKMRLKTRFIDKDDSIERLIFYK
ncbi:hypothetical protein KKB18_05715, partial [bacterium]|nr:hypothetical protein [bacterium]